MGTKVCAVCYTEKIIQDFDSKVKGAELWVDPVCKKCRMAGRMTLEELANRPHAGGRPRIQLPLGLIKELYNQGLGYKRIASAMKELGYKVSASTVWRKLQEN